MSIQPGTRLGPYEIASLLGAGGMGEVYKARDTRLDRAVAVKILPPHLSSNPQFRERFDREARSVSAISHPHICALYDVGSTDGVHYLVMEYLEGEPLSQRTAKGPLALEQVIRYGVEIASALAAAHRQGIIHRDLKPGNIMLTKSGTKLLDFGLAKSAVSAPQSGVTNLPTEQKALTQEGSILGTYQYMAPEQLAGEESDARTDIWALGCVLYEMATGRRAFEGKNKTSLIATIVSGEPHPIGAVQPLAPPALEHVIRKCLSKEPDSRWQSAHDIAEELKWISEAGSQAGVAVSPRLRRRARVWMGIAALALIALASLATMLVLQRRRLEAPTHFTEFPPPNHFFSEQGLSFAVSPDGTRIAYCTETSNTPSRLWVRSMNSFDAISLPGTDNATKPFWSPDGKTIAFFSTSDRKLKKIDLGATAPETICPAHYGVGGTWNEDGTIVFAKMFGDALYRVPASGGEPVAVTKLDATKRESVHAWPKFLPDGKHFLFLGRTAAGVNSAIYLGSIDGMKVVPIAPADALAGVLSDGRVLFVRDGRLLGQKFDLGSRTLEGTPRTVIDRVAYSTDWAAAAVSIAENALVYASSLGAPTELVWFDRGGRRLETIGKPGFYNGVKLSPDEREVAVVRTDPQTGGQDIWTIDVARGVESRITTHPSSDAGPIWSPDASKLYFYSEREGLYDLYETPLGGESTLLFKSDRDKQVMDVSPDGSEILFEMSEPNEGDNIYSFDLATKKIRKIVATPFADTAATYSPDGRWIAYQSLQSGRWEIYAQPAASVGRRTQISTEGGLFPIWSSDGKEIVYRDLDSNIVSVFVRETPRGLEVSPGKVLFKAPTVTGGADVTRDGQRFLIAAPVDESSTGLRVVLNWKLE